MLSSKHHAVGNVVSIGTPSNQRRTLVDVRVPDLSRFVIALVVGPKEVAR
jgi:hypothetical protein